MIVKWTAWPALLALCIAGTQIGFYLGQPDIAFLLTYVLLMISTLLLERALPHEPEWLKRDGQLAQDITHSLVSTAAVQGVLQFTGMVALAMGIGSIGPGLALWPESWPMAFQVCLAMVVLEFATYWAHRIAHEWKPLWYFHAVHHSVGRLSVINNGRFHFVDALKSALPGTLLLLACGATLPVMTWVSALTGYVGLLTHCNADLRFGYLSLLFNTPELHRWHHSKDLREGDKNYGESLMLWDWLFGTWFHEPHRRPPVGIGIKDSMPDGFLDQIVWPFKRLTGPTT